MAKATESPIEDDMLHAMKTVHAKLIDHGRIDIKPFVIEATNPAHIWAIHVGQQVRIGRYRADFMLGKYISDGQAKMVCVECDGRQFHRSTPEQRTRDEIRDSWFRRWGIDVVRFTGSQIMRDPFKCAHEAMTKITGEPTRDQEFRWLGEIRFSPYCAPPAQPTTEDYIPEHRE